MTHLIKSHDNNSKDHIKYSLISSWVLNNFGYSSPEEWIINQARILLKETKQKVPPINLKTLCQYLGIKIIFKNVDTTAIDPEASLKVENNKFTIEIIYSAHSKTRARFSIAHEIAHTFFFNITAIPPKRIFTRFGAVAEEEKLCNIAASEILMPENLVRARTENLPTPNERNFSLEIFLKLLKDFDVSPPAMARRLCEDLSIWNSIMIGCSRYHGDNSIEGLLWRLSWCFTPKIISNQFYLPHASTHPKLRFEIIKETYRKGRSIVMSELISNFKLGNLVKVISNLFPDQKELYIYATPISPKIVTQLNLITQSDYVKPKSSEVVICIPLPPTSS